MFVILYEGITNKIPSIHQNSYKYLAWEKVIYAHIYDICSFSSYIIFPMLCMSNWRQIELRLDSEMRRKNCPTFLFIINLEWQSNSRVLDNDVIPCNLWLFCDFKTSYSFLMTTTTDFKRKEKENYIHKNGGGGVLCLFLVQNWCPFFFFFNLQK